MKAILTGMNGTVAPALARHLGAASVACVAWDRSAVPTEDLRRGGEFIAREAPDVFFQIAMGSPDWIEFTAAQCRERRIRFVYTSTVSVFDGGKPGPFAVDHPTDAPDDYGRYKADCERRIRSVNPDALIVRIGWQIGRAPGSNNMVDFLCRAQAEKGGIDASTGWIPSCAFLEDTAEGLHRLATSFSPGTYQLEGNPGWSFHAVVQGLNHLLGMQWAVRSIDEPRKDIRMLDDRIAIGKLDARLSA